MVSKESDGQGSYCAGLKTLQRNPWFQNPASSRGVRLFRRRRKTPIIDRYLRCFEKRRSLLWNPDRVCLWGRAIHGRRTRRLREHPPKLTRNPKHLGASAISRSGRVCYGILIEFASGEGQYMDEETVVCANIHQSYREPQAAWGTWTEIVAL